MAGESEDDSFKAGIDTAPYRRGSGQRFFALEAAVSEALEDLLSTLALAPQVLSIS